MGNSKLHLFHRDDANPLAAGLAERNIALCPMRQPIQLCIQTPLHAPGEANTP